MSPPVGYIKAEDRLEKDPDRRVQEAVLSVFAKFTELGSVRQTLLWFLGHGQQLPAQTADGVTVWKRPTHATVYRMLTTPAYGGAYAYGRSESVTQYEDGQPRYGSRRRPRNEWSVLIPDAHEGYVTWDQFEQTQLAIGGNQEGPHFIQLQAFADQVAEMFILVFAADLADIHDQPEDCVSSNARDSLGGPDGIAINQASDNLCASGCSQLIHKGIMLERSSIVNRSLRLLLL